MCKNNNEKVVLITGSSRGIGKKIAEKFAQNNFKVILNCVKSNDLLIETEKELKKINPNIISIKKDVSNYERAKELFIEIEKSFGNVDILINNAGISYIGLFNEMKPKEWEKVININLYSVFNCTNLCLPSMISKKDGCIINISSIWGEVGASCEAVYSASKGAINSFSKALAKELGPSNIRVNSISCGAINTDMNSFMTKEEKNEFESCIPLMRFGNTKEVSELVYFLCSEKASYLTGQVIRLDGGFI